MLTKLPGVSERVETGPIQFGDDWPGVFIRGDNALADAMMLEQALKHISLPDDLNGQIARSVIEGLITTLRSRHIDQHR